MVLKCLKQLYPFRTVPVTESIFLIKQVSHRPSLGFISSSLGVSWVHTESQMLSTCPGVGRTFTGTSDILSLKNIISNKTICGQILCNIVQELISLWMQNHFHSNCPNHLLFIHCQDNIIKENTRDLTVDIGAFINVEPKKYLEVQSAGFGGIYMFSLSVKSRQS